MEIKNKSIREFIKRYAVLDERCFDSKDIALRNFLQDEIIISDDTDLESIKDCLEIQK